MRTRSITSFVALAALALGACGGGEESKALSEDDFVDALSDVCDDAQQDLDRLEFPTDGDFGDFADDARRSSSAPSRTRRRSVLPTTCRRTTRTSSPTGRTSST
jgi:hypothetical protein